MVLIAARHCSTWRSVKLLRVSATVDCCAKRSSPHAWANALSGRIRVSMRQIAWQPLMMLTKQVRSLSWGVYNTFFFASVRAVERRAQKNRVVASDSQAVPTAPIVYYSSSLRGQAIDSSWHTSNQNDIIPFSMLCYSYFSKLDTLKFRAKFGWQHENACAANDHAVTVTTDSLDAYRKFSGTCGWSP